MKPFLVAALVAIAVARFGQVAYRGLTYSVGDFYASIPGAYVERINPTLWASPDLENIQGKDQTYLRGPTQYLTLYPIAYLDSYAAIARLLLVVYAGVMVAAVAVMCRTFAGASGSAVPWWLVFSSTFLFFPLLQAYVAREFEVVIMAATAIGFWAAVRGRLAMCGAVLSYVAFYKYLPFAALPYLVLRRWWRALAGYAVATAVTLGLAEWAFGLVNFANNHIPGMATGLVTSLGSTTAFCDGSERLLRFTQSGQETSMRFALCGISQHLPFPPSLAYVTLVGGIVGLAAYGFFRAEGAGRPLPDGSERWRRVWELSLVVIAYTTFFYAHYYYLSVLIIPLNALLVRAYQAWPRRRQRLAWWGSAYLLLAGFLLPPSWTGRLLQVDVWNVYMKSFAFFGGELLLTGLVLREYLTLPLTAAHANLPDSPA